jgi:hypothetical protein
MPTDLELAELHAPVRRKVTEPEHAALLRLLKVASSNTGQSRRVADFLLAWWNAASCGSFDLTTAWSLDTALVDDVITVFGLAVRCGSYPDTLGYAEMFGEVIAQWRPELVDRDAHGGGSADEARDG